MSSDLGPDRPSGADPSGFTALAVRGQLDAAAARALMLATAVAAVTGFVLVTFLFAGISTQVRLVMQAGLVVLLAVLALTYWRVGRIQVGAPAVRWLSFLALLTGVLILGLLAAVVGIGVRAPSLGLIALLIALAGMLTGMRGGLALALVSLLMLLALYGAETRGWIEGERAASAQPATNRMFVLMLLVLIGTLAGWAMSSIYQHALERATLLGERLQGLLQLGTDWVWELDAQARFTQLSPSMAARSGLDPAPWIGRRWWEVPGAVVPAADWGALQERIRAGQPFHDQLVQFDGPAGRRISARLSGEPLFDSKGRCIGWRGVGHDVSAQVDEEQRRLRVQEQLAEAKQQAEAASSAKSAFLATMSHEIRTPLNGALGMIRLAIEAGDDGERRDECLRHAAASASTLGGIISDILDLSRVESGRLQLETSRFDTHELTDTVVQAWSPQAREKGLALVCQIAPDLPRWVLGDPLRVRQVLVNFVANAIKFTSTGRVELIVKPAARAAHVRFEVRDTGMGIAPEVQQLLFQPFVQADRSTTRRFGGTGLGLSICRELAALMGGEVGVVSQPGQGSVFWAELPLPATAPPQSPAQSAAPAGRPLHGMRVLVAEDNAVNMLIARETLLNWGAQVDEAGDGAQAVQRVIAAAVAGRHYEAVLMDMHMPAMNGLDATLALRERFDGQQLPIIALTAAALVSEQQRALEAGMNDFVAKPIDPPQLLAALRRARESRIA
jgi:PAS domain S-box-containing protein